ncbi:DUF1015 domain-containing protein [Intestinimonas timonensis]|uniref:DUF1015 domain-containing protein n=1 Tax=Intestinimonas timonensis TaxID=1689270 RepID=UPI0024B1A4D9|nr:DUF1015 domain-containing protein [Intestinimonas timonensis]
MDERFQGLPFGPADILLPQNCDLTRWAVVACDQYTSQPEYWQRVERFVGNAPSALHLILPESSLDGPNVETDIMDVTNTMSRYLREGIFRTCPNALIYVERTLESGKVRKGLVGMVDLEEYDYEAGATTSIRCTEGTILSRIPPRVAVRKNASVELPHVMLLTDDPQGTVIEPLTSAKDRMEKCYDFELMEHSGHLRGWLLDEEEKGRVAQALKALADPAAFHDRYGAGDVLLFAVGDGNHSLATAKACYERQKARLSPEQWADLPARYALVELVNLHDPTLEFEPIHRVLFGVNAAELLEDLKNAHPGAYEGVGEEGHVLRYVWEQGAGAITVPHPGTALPVATLQTFLDRWLSIHKGRIDYIHGADVARSLADQPGNLAFLLPAMGKEELFPTVLHDGALPRKTFSMGEAQDKRFYLEGRKIR